MKIAYINVRTGIYDQFYHLLEFVQSDRNISILCVAESKVSIKEEIPQIEGFQSYCLNPGKLIIYVRCHIGLTVVPLCEGMPAFVVKGRQMTVLCMYSEYTKNGIGEKIKLSKKKRLEYIKQTYYAYDKMQFKRSLVIGDLNFCYFDDECKESKELRRFFEARGFVNKVNQFTKFKVRAENDRNSSLDYCFVRDMPGRLRIEPFSDSDHDLLCWELPSNETIRKRRRKIVISTPTEKSEKFLKESPLDAASSYADKQNRTLDENYESLNDWCLEYKKQLERKVWKNDLDVPWWNPTLTELKRAMKAAKTVEEKWYHKRKYKYYFKYFHKMWVEKKYNQNKNPFFKKKGSTCEKLVVDGEEVTDGEKICDHILDHFIGKIEKCKRDSKPNWAHVVEEVKRWVSRSNEHNIPLNEDGSAKMWDIGVPNRAEVQALLREVNAKRSSGQSGVSTSLLKEVEGAVLDTLTVIVQKSIATGNFAKPWHEIVGVPILKANKSPTDKASFRVVGLENEVVKCISYWLGKKVAKKLESFNVFCEKMHGFRSGFSISSFNDQVIERLLEAQVSKEYSSLTLTDMSSAYDLLQSGLLLGLMGALGAGPKLLGWLKSLYAEKVITIKNNGKMAKKRTYTLGLIQGNSFSTLGFNVCIFPIRLFAKGDMKIYADDILLQTTTDVKLGAEEHLRRIEKDYFDFEKYVADIGMVSSREKLQVCTWAKKLPEELKQFELAGEMMKDEKSVRVLGLKLDKAMTFSEFIHDIISRVKQRAGQIRLRGKYLPIKAKMALYEGWVMGKVQFGMDIYASFLNCEQLKELNMVCNYAFRAACNMFRRSSDCITNIRAKYKKASFYQVVRDRVERTAYKKIEKFRKKDSNVRNVTRAAMAGEVKRYNNLHKKSIELFQRRAINEWKLYEIKSEKDLKKLQSMRKEYEFRNGIHLEPDAKRFSRLDFKSKNCGVENRNVNKLSADGSRPPKIHKQKTSEIKPLSFFAKILDFQKKRDNHRKMGKKNRNV